MKNTLKNNRHHTIKHFILEESKIRSITLVGKVVNFVPFHPQ